MKHRSVRGRGTRIAILLAACAAAWGGTASAQTVSASKAFRDGIGAVQTSLAAGDLATASGALSGLAPSTPYEKYIAASLQLELAGRRRDARAQRSAVSAILSSGAMPADQEGYMRYLAGYFAAQAGEGDQAIANLVAARNLGYNGPQSGLLLADAYLRKRKPTEARAVISQTIAHQDEVKQPVPAPWLDRAASLAYGQKDWAAYAAISARRLRTEATPGDWRSAIVNYINGAAPDREAQLDLMRLQNAVGAMASERDYEAYAALAGELGYAQEAKAVTDAGRSNGKLLASASSTKGKKNVASTAKPKSKGKGAAVSGASAADKLLSASQYAQAVSAYRTASDNNAANRDRNGARLAIALARSGDIAGARAAFAQVGGKWRDVAMLWDSWAALQAAPPPARLTLR